MEVVVGKKRDSEGCSKKAEDSQISIFVLVTDIADANLKIISRLYELKMDASKYEYPTAQVCSGKCEDAVPIDPILTFNNEDNYAHGMACVLLDSKLYFMGGSFSYKLYSDDVDDEVIQEAEENNPDMYPPSVHVYDLITRQYHPNKLQMTSGKSIQPFTFVADGKIFVLSTTKMPSQTTSFESFDPNTGLSIKLDDIPCPDHFFDYRFPFGSALVGRQFFVSFHTSGRRNQMYMFLYDLNTCKWKSCPPFDYCLNVNKDSVFIRDTLYSAASGEFFDLFIHPYLISSHAPLDPISPNFHDLEFVPMFKHDAKDWPTLVNPLGCASTRLVNLGGLLNGTNTDSRCLGYVELFYEDSPDYELANQESRCFLRFVAFEDIRDTIKTTVNGRPEFTYFRARTLHSSHFSSSGKFDTGPICAACAFRTTSA